MPRVGIFFELEPEANRDLVSSTLKQLRFGQLIEKGAGIHSEGDPIALFAVEPLRGRSDDRFATEVGLLGLSRELEERDAKEFAYQAHHLPRAVQGVKSVHVAILPTIE